MSSLIQSIIEKAEAKRVQEDDVGGNDISCKLPKPSPDNPDNYIDTQSLDISGTCNCGRRRPDPKAVAAYVNAPPHMNLFGFYIQMLDKSNDKTLLVKHLPSQINEDSLFLQIFEAFGEVITANLAPLDIEGTSRGLFGFVTFVNKEDAEKAINTLHGSGPYGTETNTLSVSWALTRKQLTRGFC